MTLCCRQAVRDLLDLDFDAIPLKPGSKSALRSGWQEQSALLQWTEAPEDANVGLRCGGARALCVIDSDDKSRTTWPAVFAILCSLGLEPGSYPLIETPNHGTHVYLTLVGSLPGNYHLLRHEVGSGELRYGPGAYVVCPPSTLPGGEYKIVAGDLRELPKVEANDLAELIHLETTSREEHAVTGSGKPSRRAMQMLAGKGLERYPTRSEAEQAIITSLVNSGLDFAQILELFIANPAGGKFHELFYKSPSAAEIWLKGSFEAAHEWTACHQSPAWLAAATALEWANSRPWPGRTGFYDRAVFLPMQALHSGQLGQPTRRVPVNWRSWPASQKRLQSRQHTDSLKLVC